jgi:hypothetical protein
MPLLLSAAIPLIWWQQGPDSASRLQQAGLSQVCLAPEVASAWSGVAGAPPACSGAARTKLPAPRIDRKIAVASATTSPWIVANGWRFLRSPGGSFLSEAPAGSTVLAMSEAFAYRADVAVKIADSDLPAAASFQQFLAALPEAQIPPVADVTFVDDGTALAGEALNLMLRRNLLVRAARESEPASGTLRVKIGDDAFPKSLASNPDQFAIAVRRKLTDEKRTIRIYGSEMVLAQLEGSSEQKRLHLINYNRNPMEGLRIRIRGEYKSIKLSCFGYQGSTPEDVSAAGGFTEFSIPEFKEYALVELR